MCWRIFSSLLILLQVGDESSSVCVGLGVTASVFFAKESKDYQLGICVPVISAKLNTYV